MELKSRRLAITLLLVTLAVPSVISVLGVMGQQAVVWLTGTLRQGVESGCIILEADNGERYNLLGVPNNHPPLNSRVIVEGYEQKGVVTICMEGTPFKVLEIQPVPAATTPMTSVTTATVSVTTTTSMLATTTVGGVPGYPPESLVAGIAVGFLILIVVRIRMGRQHLD